MANLTVRVREKHQITLPKAIAQAAAIHPDDLLHATYTNGVITLEPVRGAKSGERVGAASYLGALTGTYGKGVDQTNARLRAERDSWDR
jgi:bifunctional DNA-binding transcriptional regulator/antitoxin component of YhaV-PrlF toxin-antitoxin module